ncbi:DNA methyltransferase [Sphingobacterium lumbrici]|uniref:DNA methyltransferase n=1 Tax=Sphingobacterium lumbrici TaxID=2559600 RepID=UPI001127D353|nr:site-specific DNA-methyltransferase [Sphingobacterium lumbrici]
MSNYENLQKVLKEIFEMDKADLDFGIYRVMNQKRDQVNDFIDKKLPKEIKDILAKIQSKDSISLQAELDKMGKNLDDAGVARESSGKYLTLQQQVTNAIDTNALEQEVFSHLANFFKRYYKDGDFISLRRYKIDVYAIPYEGEEVKLHWANADQYYIKTSEYLKNYAFKLSDGKKVYFQLKEASTEQNNNKTQGDVERRFALYEELPLEAMDGELHINFTYETHKKSVKQDDLAKQALEWIQNNIPAEFTSAFDKAPTEKNKNRTLLEKHLNDFISRNSFDYFIHKDLGGFLRRELDFYIKNEVLFIDDINTENPIYFTAQLSKIKALKTVASKIIAFLAQIEDFQKKLWLKKKFVISTNYCITLDRIPEKYYEEIFTNQAQLDDWNTLYNIVITSESRKSLSEHPFLVLDTKFFSEDFKDRLLAEFDNLDEETDGLLINSENFQALNLMQEKYKEKVKAIYIDPPYNTGGDDFIYKDNFQHSSWMSLMQDRLDIARNFLLEDGSFTESIDLKELDKNLLLLDNVFGEENKKNIITIKRGSVTGAKVVNPGVVNVSEYVLNYSNNADKWLPEKAYREKDYDNRYGTVIVNFDDDFENWQFESVLESFAREKGIQKSKLKKELGGDYDNELFNFVIKNANRVVQFASLDEKSVSADAVKLKHLSIENPDKLFYQSREGKNDYYLFRGKLILFYKDRLIQVGGQLIPGEPISDIWDDVLPNDLHNEGGVSLRKGKKPEKLIHRIFDMSSKPKELIMDYFLGSGTSTAVALKSNRKSLGVEQGKYFRDVTLKRIKNVLKGADKSGITNDTLWQGGGIIKYQVLESYEDALNNLQLGKSSQDGLFQFSDAAQEDYLLNYMLDVESQDHLFNIAMFRNPFNYQLKVTENNELVPTKVDLVETFNYLIGLYVERIQRVGDIKFVEGKTREGIKTLVIWRNLETTTNEETAQRFRKIYDSVRSSEFDHIYINGDHHFDNIRTGEDTFKVKSLEETFFKKMFNISEL